MCLLLLLCAPGVFAQTATEAVAAPRVKKVEIYSKIRRGDGAGLGDRIVVYVDQFPTLMQQAGGSCNGIVLFLDALAMKGLTPESCDPTRGTVRYQLARTDQTDKTWHSLLGSPNGWTRPITVSVGPTDQLALPSDVRNFELRILPKFQFYLCFVVLSIALIAFVVLCRKTSMIRSGVMYSLSRFQMAFWFFLVIAAYVFMWMITGELDTITESILALVGIGSGTALGAALIDTNAPGVKAIEKSSNGFLRDILDDGNGISFHRFQMFVWTVVLGIIFCASVFRHLAMPEFSATLLGLMGISSGTYLGFKFPEKSAAATTTPATAPVE
jgi:hypothetical protein